MRQVTLVEQINTLLNKVCTAALLILRLLGSCNLQFMIATLLDLVSARGFVLVSDVAVKTAQDRPPDSHRPGCSLLVPTRCMILRWALPNFTHLVGLARDHHEFLSSLQNSQQDSKANAFCRALFQRLPTRFLACLFLVLLLDLQLLRLTALQFMCPHPLNGCSTS